MLTARTPFFVGPSSPLDVDRVEIDAGGGRDRRAVRTHGPAGSCRSNTAPRSDHYPPAHRYLAEPRCEAVRPGDRTLRRQHPPVDHDLALVLETLLSMLFGGWCEERRAARPMRAALATPARCGCCDGVQWLIGCLTKLRDWLDRRSAGAQEESQRALAQELGCSRRSRAGGARPAHGDAAQRKIGSAKARRRGDDPRVDVVGLRSTATVTELLDAAGTRAEPVPGVRDTVDLVTGVEGFRTVGVHRCGGATTVARSPASGVRAGSLNLTGPGRPARRRRRPRDRRRRYGGPTTASHDRGWSRSWGRIADGSTRTRSTRPKRST